MKRLTDEQVGYISDQVNKSIITSEVLKEDMIDHFCCLIEDDLNKGINFEVSCENVFKTIFPDGFDKEHKKNTVLLTPRNMRLVKIFLFILAFLTTVCISMSFMFRAFHWNYSKDLFAVAAFIFVLILIPLFLLYYFRKTFSRIDSRKSRYIIGIIGITILLAGLTSKYFHLPGASILLLFGVAILNFVFLPFLFYKLYKNESNNNRSGIILRRFFYLFGFLSIALFLLTLFLKLLHLPGSGISLIITSIIFNLGFLPLLFIRLYKNYSNKI